MVTEEKNGLQNQTEMIGICIRNNRKRLKITQKQLADRVGVSEHHLSMLENGRRNTSSLLIRKIAKELGISTEELFQGEEYVIKQNNADYQRLCRIYNPKEISEALKIAEIYLKSKNQI
jgi:transcriptional regulator with XRE-family HTH domain